MAKGETLPLFRQGLKPTRLTCFGRELSLSTEEPVPEGEDPRDYSEDRDLLHWHDEPSARRHGLSVSVSFEFGAAPPEESDGLWTIRLHLQRSDVGDGVSVDASGYTLERAQLAAMGAVAGRVSQYVRLSAVLTEAV